MDNVSTERRRRNMRKQVLTVFMAGVLTASISMTALAGWEQEGTNWKYNDNGAYAANG